MTDTKKLRELCEAATKGEWEAAQLEPQSIDVIVGALHLARIDLEAHYAECGEAPDRTDDESKANAAFIAAANPSAVLALLDEVEKFQWKDIGEYHEDYGDCLFAFFIGQELQAVEWASPLEVDGPCMHLTYDRLLFKRVSMRNEEVSKLLLPKTEDAGVG